MGDRRPRVEIVLAFRDRQYVQQHTVAPGTCVAQLVRDSRIFDHVPDVDISRYSWAIHGRAVGPDTVLHEGDRVELLRPLSIDPKLARRRRAQLKAMTQRADETGCGG